MLRTMALGTLILNAFSVRTAPGHFMRCRCSAIQINVQTNTYHPRRPRATSSLLSCRPNRSRSAPSSRSVIAGIVDSGRKDGFGNVDADDPKATCIGAVLTVDLFRSLH